MGNGGSKQEQHVFNADAPVRFSQNVVDSLQNSAETDSTRAQDYELKIQSRVNSELKKLRDEQSRKLADLTSSLSSSSSSSDTKNDSPLSKVLPDKETITSHLSSPFSSSNDTSSKDSTSRSHDSVQKEIMTLRAKLDARKKLEKPSKEVEKAKEELVRCLRTKDRRPLDCWEEVEAFKAEVGKLERAFVERAGR
ncbi:hypothetical protein BDY17DRAFT_327385 [Neohortaea acidophila]|uniref:DUF1690-domain-containing protein n=1 Tax=Neohortaea acidophila TaxID=245834 RepID=A0A6A6PHG6_9PEZI|nr:uncharacterized protein BDY17DRAFT_327385 [Neohortaea acidophila]KAF2479412.1 hypothetical protein BDY17DRAFT_327385 [Neohortaea acidophila]